MAVHSQNFKRVMVANRGEIACRIMRTVQSVGLHAIAVYSEADRKAPHVKMADSHYCIGPAAVGSSYLNIENILAAAKATKADAIHPGYGFLSENAAFAQACADNGIIFIGPNIDAIDVMGDKAKSKRRMIEAGVPCVPGYQGEAQDDATLLEASKSIGYPIMVKAAAGGGGRGMRLVHQEAELAAAISLARNEAQSAFGSGDLILERAILEPRHVEIQVFADRHGNVIHLGERDCSVQRRHQKVLEESPCPAMSPELRERMGAAAVKAAQDVNYVGAGTVEFLLAATGEFYFLEMNTRLQVEHPVTEMVTGLDLVALQLRVAAGERLSLTQSDIVLSGHAIEARLYAENPSKGFLPATGHIDFWQAADGDGMRTDSGIETGSDISPFYDPMMAKIIAHGASRSEARARLIAALKQTAIFGVVNNKEFLIEALEQDDFIQGKATTAFIADNFSAENLQTPDLVDDVAILAAILMFANAQAKQLKRAIGVPAILQNWSSATQLPTPYRFDRHATDAIRLDVKHLARDDYQVVLDEQIYQVELRHMQPHHALIMIDQEQYSVLYNFPKASVLGHIIQLSVEGVHYELTNQVSVYASSEDGAGAGAVLAPMHGLLLEVFVAPGDPVAKGDRLAILEAMKMQHELLAEVDGEVQAVHIQPGSQIPVDTLIVEIEPDTD